MYLFIYSLLATRSVFTELALVEVHFLNQLLIDCFIKWLVNYFIYLFPVYLFVYVFILSFIYLFFVCNKANV